MVQRPRLWLLEEDPDNRLMCAELLEFDGFSVIAFESPGGFLGQASRPPRAAVVDAWTARSHEAAAVARIPAKRIVVTATLPSHERLWKKLGAACVVSKPFSIDLFRAAVRSLADC